MTEKRISLTHLLRQGESPMNYRLNILALTLAFFLCTATLADAQETQRTSAEIQAEIDALQIELQKAKTAEGIPLTVGQFTRPESERQILRLLEMPARQPIILDETSTLVDLCRMLAANDIPAILDMRALADTGTSLQYGTPIVPDGFFPANTNSIKLKNVLKILFEPHELAYVVRNEMLYITTIEASRRQANMFVRVYYVGDIAPELTPEEKSKKNNVAETEGSKIITSTAGNPFGGPFQRVAHHVILPNTDSLIDVIVSCIKPMSWRMTEFGEGSLHIYTPTQSLVVSASEDVHAKIEELLTQIRQMHALHQATQAAEQ